MLFKDISYDELWGPFVRGSGTISIFLEGIMKNNSMNLFRGPLGDATYQILKL